MCIIVDNIKNEISFDDPIDNRNGNQKVGLIRDYFVFSFYNVENDEKIHFINGEMTKVKRGCYCYERHRKSFFRKVKYDSSTGKSVIHSTISQLDFYINNVIGINNGNYIDTLLS